jgi:mRNA interferase MazF
VEVKRGDVVVCAAPGDYGKPRPAVVVQSDLFNPTHASVTVCPITSELRDAPLFRLTIEPARGNGLRTRSQVMVDKLQSLRRDRIRRSIGVLPPAQLAKVDEALRLWLGLDT